MVKEFAGRGRKRPQLNIPIDNLHLDPDNPRLPEAVQGKPERELLKVLYKSFALRELMVSLANNGYFDEEPMVAIPKGLPDGFKEMSYPDLMKNSDYRAFIEDTDTNFTVVEGNRRLASVKILLDDELKNFLKIRESPEFTEDIREDISVLPVVIYARRDDVIPYLGVRHIAGVEKWNSYAKARYLANLVDERNISITDVQRSIADTSTSTRKIYTSYKMIELMEEESEGSAEKAKDNFSLLLLSLGQGSIRRYIGLPRRWDEVNFDSIISEDKIDKMVNLFSFIYGDKEKLPVIKESRDITNFLQHVLKSEKATEHLIRTRHLKDAFDRSDGEKSLLLNSLRGANGKIERSMAFVNKYREDEDLIDEIKRLEYNLEQIIKLLGE